MPDTGAPWNIPYADPTDLVRDWPDLSEDVADAVAAGLTDLDTAIDNIPVLAGIGSNVVSATKLDIFTTTSSAFTTLTGLSVTITPSSATSKILLIAQISRGDVNANEGSFFRFAGGNSGNYQGNAAGSRVRTAIGSGAAFNNADMRSESMVFVDAPNTASPVTYSVQVRTNSGATLYVNHTRVDSNSTRYPRGACSITAIEVAA